MKRFVLASALVAMALFAAVSLGGTSEANNPALWSSGPLLTCPDVNGDGVVNLVNDILLVGGAFGKFGDGNYQYIYDVGNGDGVVNIPDDILYIASRFGDLCTDLTNQQVALATQATIQYADCQDALNDGYMQSTQFVPNMGIHLANNANMLLYPNFYSGDPNNTNDQLRHPVGLICADSDPDPNIDVPAQLIGMWYVVPIPAVCALYSIQGSCQDINTQPIGYGTTNTDEDNQALNAIQKTWHKHNGLCVWNLGTTSALTAENMSEEDCLAVSGIWFSTYGWMAHLYNFIPNQDGRFRMWSTYVPGEGG